MRLYRQEITTRLSCRFNFLAIREFEDLLNESVYQEYFQKTYGVDVTWSVFNGKGKWSERIKAGLTKSGKPWSDADKQRDKAELSKLVADAPERAIHSGRLGVINTLIEAIERTLQAVKA